MKIKPFQAFSYKNKLKILKYSIGSRLINSVPKGLKNSYEFLRLLQSQGVSLEKSKGLIQFQYQIKQVNHNFSIHENSSDSDVFRQIIVEEEYKYVLELITQYNIAISNVVDAGANVGYTCIYLSHFFPKAQILALEPNKDTFNRLNYNINLNNLDNVTCIQKGLWNKETYLKADHSFRDQQAWAFRLEETSNESEKLIEVTSVNGLMNIGNWETIDFFKIDIEGGEKELFRIKDELDWLDKVKVIAIEIHDEFDCRDDIESILKDKNFKLYYSGELTIGINNTCIK